MMEGILKAVAGLKDESDAVLLGSFGAILIALSRRGGPVWNDACGLMRRAMERYPTERSSDEQR
jgi:hypothetical protein